MEPAFLVPGSRHLLRSPDFSPLPRDNAAMREHPHAARDRERRETVERHHRLKDVEEDFDDARTRASSREERQRLMDEIARFRREHREQDIERGKRSPGTGILMQEIMWARWLEVANEHEQSAATAHAAIRAGETQHLLDELRAGLVAVAAAASTVEALYEDTKYLIPERRRRSTAAKTIADGLAAVFGLLRVEREQLINDLTSLFDRRNEGLHGYSEPRPPVEHPAGFKTGSESSRFSAPECRVALAIALRVLAYAAEPPAPANRWVRRWVNDRAAYHQQVVEPIRDARGKQ